MRFARLTPLLFALAGCTRPDPAPLATPASDPAPSATPSAKPTKPRPPASAADAKRSEQARKALALVRAWNEAINAHDIVKLEPLYADFVELYGSRLSRAAALAAKRGAFVAHDHDELSGIEVTPLPGGGRAQFHKKSVAKGGKALEVTGYLELREAPGPGGFRIVAEGDTTTDANLERAKAARCESAVDALVSGTTEAKEAMAEMVRSLKGATDVTPGGMIVPPNPGDPKWAVAICEDHPERMVCLHHFSVDPVTGVVTYMGADSIDDKPIATDPALVAAVRAACH